MKTLSTKKLPLFRLNSITISQTHNLFSTSPNSAHSSFKPQRQEQDIKNVRVSVWWDFENCRLPIGANVFRVSQRIMAAIRTNGIKGPVQIMGFGDVLHLSRLDQEALSLTGINLTHIPHDGKKSADKSLFVDLMYWVSQNPPPAHLFLITGDHDFASILHRLRMNNYNILLASSDNPPGVLCSAASVMWSWNALVRGENLTGKHFNQPPDGPYNSWYGHYRAPLEDPFAVRDQATCSQAEELTESGMDPKVRPVPKAVMKQIRQILDLYPKGISITELRSELGKTSVSIDKDLYGYKRFSHFLLSMPHILNLESGSDGQHFVRAVNTGPVANYGESNFVTLPKIEGVNEKTSLPLSPDINVKEPLKNLKEQPKRVDLPQLVQDVKSGDLNEGHSCNLEERPKRGDPLPLVKSGELIEGHSRNLEEQLKRVDPPPFVKNVKSGELTEGHPRNFEEKDVESEVGFFKRIWTKWFSGKNGGSKEESSGKPENNSTSSYTPGKVKETKKNCVESISQCADHVVPASYSPSSNKAISKEGITNKKQEVFSKESFWNEMEAFIYTHKGSELVMKSTNRKQMAQNLQKQGPRNLRSLNETDLLHIVDILISDKKWVEEFPSQTYPFKLVRSVGDISFINEQENLPHHEVHKKPFGKSRSEILADCQKLVDEIVREHPKFEIGCFRNLFLARYGYYLDVQRLGYRKLATFLQIMRGVKIESNCIVPFKISKGSSKIVDSNSESELTYKSRTDDYLDSQWEELGPVERRREKGECVYEPLSNDDLSDSDDEILSSSEGLGERRVNEEDSTLLQIIDSWYASKVDDDNNNRTVDGELNISSKNDLKPSYGRKQKPTKSYSFVSDDKSIESRIKG